MSAPGQGWSDSSIPQPVEYAGTAENQAVTNAMNNAAANYADQVRHDNPFGGPPPKLDVSGVRAAQGRAQGFAQGQAQALEQGIHTKPGPDTGGHYYLGYSQNELHQMVHDQADPSAVNDQGQTWNDIGNAMIGIAQRLNQTATATEGSWQGQAAAAAHGFTASMASWHGTSGSGAVLAGNRMYEQQTALAQARAAMPPPVPQPTWQDMAKALTGNPFTAPAAVKNWFDQYDRARSNHQEMARVAQQYDGGLGGSSTMPAFTPPPTFSPTSATGPFGAAGGGAFSGGGAAAPRPGGGQPGGPGVPPGMGTSAQDAGGYPTSAPQPNAPAATGADAGLALPVMGMPAGGINPGDSYRTGGLGGARGAAPSGGPAAPGARSGAGAAAAEQAAIERGTAAGRAQPGLSGTGPMAAGRSKGGEDTEHKRAAYLLEADPNSVFGTDQRVAPPVIGE